MAHNNTAMKKVSARMTSHWGVFLQPLWWNSNVY